MIPALPCGFQSLLSWKVRCEAGTVNALRGQRTVFQSLLSWKVRCELYGAMMGRGLLVSILVILEGALRGHHDLRIFGILPTLRAAFGPPDPRTPRVPIPYKPP